MNVDVDRINEFSDSNSDSERHFITNMFQYTMSKEWFWDETATYQANHRLIFIGLHNKHGDYEWTDGSRLGYVFTADWNIIICLL